METHIHEEPEIPVFGICPQIILSQVYSKTYKNHFGSIACNCKKRETIQMFTEGGTDDEIVS